MKFGTSQNLGVSVGGKFFSGWFRRIEGETVEAPFLSSHEFLGGFSAINLCCFFGGFVLSQICFEFSLFSVFLSVLI